MHSMVLVVARGLGVEMWFGLRKEYDVRTGIQW